MDAATSEAVRASALRLLGLPETESGVGGVEVVATVLATREPDEGMRVSIGRMLGERARTAINEQAGDRTPTAVAVEKVDYSDDANCDDPQGETGNAFVRGERCYRIVLRAIIEGT